MVQYGMTGEDFVHFYKAQCATTADFQRLVYMAWAQQMETPPRLPWLWIEPSTMGQRGLFSFRAAPTMAPFLQTLGSWFDVQDTTEHACMGQIFFTPATNTAATFDWLVPSRLIEERQNAMRVLAGQPTILDWWTTFIGYTPLWMQCMLGWDKLNMDRQQQLQWSVQATTKMLPLFVKKTQAYYASTERTKLSWSIPAGDHLFAYLALVNGALDESFISMEDPSKTQLHVNWRKHAPLMLGLLDLQGSSLCHEYHIAEIPHDFLMNSMLSRPRDLDSFALPSTFLE